MDNKVIWICDAYYWCLLQEVPISFDIYVGKLFRKHDSEVMCVSNKM